MEITLKIFIVSSPRWKYIVSDEFIDADKAGKMLQEYQGTDFELDGRLIPPQALEDIHCVLGYFSQAFSSADMFVYAERADGWSVTSTPANCFRRAAAAAWEGPFFVERT